MSKVFKFTGQILKNLFSEPVTTKYPYEPAHYYERTRGHITIEIEKCILCGLCSRACPSDAIKVDRKASTWTISRFDCVQCGYCVDKCPKKCLNIIPGYPEPMPEKSLEVHNKPIEKEKTFPYMDDSKCVYCTMCARKCPQSALEVNRKEKIWKLDKAKCVGCEVCISACPKKCLEMKTEKEIRKLDALKKVQKAKEAEVKPQETPAANA